MYEIDYSNMIVRVRVSDSARPPACPKQVFPHTSPPEARNSKKVERSNWLDTQIRCLIDYCIYTFSFFFSQKMNYLDKMNMFVYTSHLIIVTSCCQFKLIKDFPFYIFRGPTIKVQLFVVMGIAIGHILDGK